MAVFTLSTVISYCAQASLLPHSHFSPAGQLFPWRACICSTQSNVVDGDMQKVGLQIANT